MSQPKKRKRLRDASIFLKTLRWAFKYGLRENRPTGTAEQEHFAKMYADPTTSEKFMKMYRAEEDKHAEVVKVRLAHDAAKYATGEKEKPLDMDEGTQTCLDVLDKLILEFENGMAQARPA